MREPGYWVVAVFAAVILVFWAGDVVVPLALLMATGYVFGAVVQVRVRLTAAPVA